MQGGQRISSKPATNSRLNIGDNNTRWGNGLRSLNPTRHRRRTVLFQWVAGRQHPPNHIQPKPFQRFAADMNMASMGGVKRSAQHANAHTLRNVRSTPHYACAVLLISGLKG
jgi:hypothetical protein